MSKYSKIMTMKNGGKMEIRQASVGLFAKLVGKGAGKGVEMLQVSKKAIQEGALKKAFPEKFDKALKAYKKGDKEMLKGLKLKDAGSRIKSPGPGDLAKAGASSNYVERATKAAGIGGVGAVVESETGIIDKLKKIFNKE
jgi:hypothetical protein